MAKGHTRYCGLVRVPHVEKTAISGRANHWNCCIIV